MNRTLIDAQLQRLPVNLDGPSNDRIDNRQQRVGDGRKRVFESAEIQRERNISLIWQHVIPL